MNKLCCNFQKYRNELFGISILSIMIFHYFEDVSSARITGALGYAAKGYIFFIGSSGVEIFLFLSGMGLFYSLSKSPLVLPFYKRRLGRVLPTYLIVGGIGWLVIDILLKRRGLRSFLSDFSTYSFWRYGERLVWYVSLILLLYLFFPLLFRLEKEIDLSGRDGYQRRALCFLCERLFGFWCWSRRRARWWRWTTARGRRCAFCGRTRSS